MRNWIYGILYRFWIMIRSSRLGTVNQMIHNMGFPLPSLDFLVTYFNARWWQHDAMLAIAEKYFEYFLATKVDKSCICTRQTAIFKLKKNIIACEGSIGESWTECHSTSSNSHSRAKWLTKKPFSLMRHFWRHAILRGVFASFIVWVCPGVSSYKQRCCTYFTISFRFKQLRYTF